MKFVALLFRNIIGPKHRYTIIIITFGDKNQTFYNYYTIENEKNIHTHLYLVTLSIIKINIFIIHAISKHDFHMGEVSNLL